MINKQTMLMSIDWLCYRKCH